MINNQPQLFSVKLFGELVTFQVFSKGAKAIMLKIIMIMTITIVIINYY